MNNKPIGVFDSGIGGLTVLKEIIKVLPNEQYIYYADTKNVPYGTKLKNEVKKYIQEVVEFLIKKEVKAIVIACNTATSIAINDLRKKYTIPIIGIEPAVKPAILDRKNKKVLIMATPITIKEEKLQNLLKKSNKQEFVDLIAMPKLVKFAENKEFTSENVKKYIIEKLKPYNIKEYSKIVLGCTHFPFFKTILKQILPNEIELIDGNIGVALRLKEVLEEKEILGKQKLNIEYYYSGVIVKNKVELEKLLI